MRCVREITSEEENFRIEEGRPLSDGRKMGHVRRDPVEAEPIGTVILIPFRVTGYDPDCDGSLMARLDCISPVDLRTMGWDASNIGLYPSTGFVVTEDELGEMAKEHLDD